SLLTHPTPTSTLFPYTTLFRSFCQRPVRDPTANGAAISIAGPRNCRICSSSNSKESLFYAPDSAARDRGSGGNRDYRCDTASRRSEEHTSELQSRENLVCRLLL